VCLSVTTQNVFFVFVDVRGVRRGNLVWAVHGLWEYTKYFLEVECMRKDTYIKRRPALCAVRVMVEFVLLNFAF
jgi:hypothetical protein